MNDCLILNEDLKFSAAFSQSYADFLSSATRTDEKAFMAYVMTALWDASQAFPLVEILTFLC